MEVRLKTLDGRWEQVGVDRLSRLTPQGIQATSNEHGSDTCRFTLKRAPGAIYPDLAAFTPCELLHDGRVVWSGRVWETPTKEGADAGISVEGRGWQYHLDDQPYATPYAKIRLEAKDIRTLTFASLNNFTVQGEVSADTSGVTIGWAKGTQIATNQAVGVYYDLGPEYEKSWPDLYIDLRSYATDPNIQVYVRTYTGTDPVLNPGSSSDLYFNTITTINAVGGYDLVPMTATTPMRYVAVFMYYAGGGGTFGANEQLQIREFKVFGKSHYRQMMTEANVVATDIAQDAIAKAAPLLKPAAERTPPVRDEILGNPKLDAYYRFDNLTIGTPTIVPDKGPYGRDLTVTNSGSLVQYTNSSIDNSLATEGADTGRGQLGFGGDDYGSAAIPFDSGHRAVAGIFSISGAQYGSVFHIGNSGVNGWGLYVGGATGGGATGTRLWLLKAGVAWVDTGIVLSTATDYFFTAYWTREYANKQLVLHVWDSYGAGTFGDFYSGPATLVDPPTGTFTVGGNSAADGLYGIVDEIALFSAPFDEYVSEDSYQERLAKSVWAKDDGPVHRTSFWIPEYPMDAAQTPREVLDAVNSLHDYVWKVNHLPSLEFYERPVSAQFEVGRWHGAEFEEASANAGEEIYNQVRIEGTDVNGEAVIVERGGFQTSENIMPLNGTFEGGTFGWSVFDPTKSAIAGYMGAPATTSPSPGATVLRVEVTAGPHSPTAITSSFIGSFQPGRMYRARAWMYRTTHTSDIGEFYVTNTVGSNVETITKTIPQGGPYPGAGSGFWFPIYVDFRFDVIGTIALNVMQQTDGTNNYIFYLDGVEIQELPESLPTRYGFIRSKTITANSALTVPVAEKLGDVWINGRTSTPFKGSITHTNPSGVRYARTGENVHPAEMLNNTGEKILFSHRADPDTGDWGRLGTISTVAYDDATKTSTVAIDNTRLSFEALLGRFSAVVGSAR